MKLITYKSAMHLLAASIISMMAIGNASADWIAQDSMVGVFDPDCVNANSVCAPDAAFTRSDGSAEGGYRVGGTVSWTFDLDTTAFSYISSINVGVGVVGLSPDLYPNNSDGSKGHILEIDGIPVAPLFPATGGRDWFSFDLTSALIGLGDGTHTFSVVAFDSEEWAGVDIAVMRIEGESTVVPVPAAAWLLGSGLLGLAGVARRKAA
jgi:hypothetical protein